LDDGDPSIPFPSFIFVVPLALLFVKEDEEEDDDDDSLSSHDSHRE
jgi:hypothetical protein